MNVERTETVGERLKRLRLDRGLSQRELAAPGVSYAYVSRIEAGTRNPSVKALRKLAARLDVPATYLEDGRRFADGVELLLLAEAALDRDLANLARLAVRRARTRMEA